MSEGMWDALGIIIGTEIAGLLAVIWFAQDYL